MKNLISVANTRFRFLSLNKMQAYTLGREVMDSSFSEHSEAGRYIGCVLLTEFNIDDINDFYVRQKVDVDDCDILVSAVSGLDETTVEVPQIVNHMLKYIDCKLRYSFKAA